MHGQHRMTYYRPGLAGNFYRENGLSAFGGQFYGAPRRAGLSGLLASFGDAATGAVATAKAAVSAVPTPLWLAGAAGAAYLLLRKKGR